MAHMVNHGLGSKQVLKKKNVTHLHKAKVKLGRDMSVEITICSEALKKRLMPLHIDRLT